MNSEQFRGEKEIIKEDARIQWDRNISIREEFGGDFDAYLAYKVVSKKGWARVQGRQAEERG
jgi:hypothetical protein